MSDASKPCSRPLQFRSGEGAGTHAGGPGIGQRQFVEGLGRYVDDLPHGDCLHVAFVRSPHPHARIVGVERAAALQSPGVQAVVVGDELGQVAAIPVNRFTPDLKLPDYHALSGDVVRYVGEPIAAVVATTRAQAEDAAQLRRDRVRAAAGRHRPPRPRWPRTRRSSTPITATTSATARPSAAATWTARSRGPLTWSVCASSTIGSAPRRWSRAACSRAGTPASAS